MAAAIAGNLDIWVTLVEDGRGRTKVKLTASIKYRFIRRSFQQLAQGGSLFELAEGRYGDVITSTQANREKPTHFKNTNLHTFRFLNFQDSSDFFRKEGADYGYYNLSEKAEEEGLKETVLPNRVVYNKAQMACNVVKVYK